MIRTLTFSEIMPSAMVWNWVASPWAFCMSYLMPAASKAAFRYFGSSVPQRCELLVSGRMIPTLPAAVLPLPLLPEPLLLLLSLPQAATLPTARRPTAARANIPLRIT